MGMKQTIDVINAMEADGVIARYAIAGAVATYNYIAPTVSEDLDLLVAFNEGSKPSTSGIISLAPIFSYLGAKGHREHRKEGIVIAGWPVQFLPVANDLDLEALTAAPRIEIRIDEGSDAVTTRVLLPEHLVAIALRVGR